MKDASFTISDYLEETPVEVIEGIARTILSRIRAEEEMEYPDCVRDWLTSKEFRELKPAEVHREK